MSNRYYIYDAYTDSVAEFKQYSRGSRGQNITAGQLEGQGLRTPKMVGPDQSFKGGALVHQPRGAMTGYAAPKKTAGKAKRTLMQNLIGTSVKGRLARGAGALGAVGALAGGGYALKKRADRKAQERSSIKGRVKRLLGW